MVHVDLRNGTTAELPLLDVGAMITMTANVGETRVQVTEPLVFEGTYVDAGRGAPAGFLPRAYRSADRGIRIAANTPLEMSLGTDDSQVVLHARAWSTEDTLDVIVPCASMRAGAPRASMGESMRPDNARGRFVIVALGTEIRSAASGGELLARVTGEHTGGAWLRGTLGPTRDGMTRITVSAGPVQVTGFVPAGTAEDGGRPLAGPSALGLGPAAYGASVPVSETTRRRVHLGPGTPVYANVTTTEPWAHVATGLDAQLTTFIGSTARGYITIGEASLPVLRCRYDGVVARPSCGGTRGLPRLALESCDASGCGRRAFVAQP